MNPEQFLPRLAFIKYLYELGLEQSYRPLPRAYVAVLTFHDAVESFLALACEHHSAAVDKRTDFDKYFVKLVEPPIGLNLAGKAAMIRLNNGRVNLKHYGILADPTFIEEMRVAVRNFFEDNTPLVFGVALNSISMVDLIDDPEARANLAEALALIEQKNIKNVVRKTALAFYLLTSNYEDSKRKNVFRSPFRFGDSLTFESSFHLHIKDKEIARFVDKARDAIQALQGAVRILSLGFDYRRYLRFQNLTPTVWRSIDGQIHVKICCLRASTLTTFSSALTS